MYAETGLLYPCFQNFSQDVQQFEDLCRAHKSNASISNLLSSSMLSDYDLLGGEGDLFKAPEAIIIEDQQPIMTVDPNMISMISSCGGVENGEELSREDSLLNEVLYECEKNLLEQAAMEIPLYETLEIKIPTLSIGETSSFQKSVSSECLSSMDWTHGFLEIPGEDYRMRRAFSESDIKTLGNGNVIPNGNGKSSSVVNSPHEARPMVIGKSISEERKEQLTRYRTKKTKRNFGRKIKYACRKALADSQPRIRGRFAKTEEYCDGKGQ